MVSDESAGVGINAQLIEENEKLKARVGELEEEVKMLRAVAGRLARTIFTAAEDLTNRNSKGES